MSGILFLVDIIAFVVVAYWAYANDRAGVEGGDQGLLKMKKVVIAPAAAKRAPRWMSTKRPADPDELAEDPVLRRVQPQWRRQLRPRRR